MVLLHQKSTKTAPVLWRCYWRFGKIWQNSWKIFRAGQIFLEFFWKNFPIFSKSPVTPPQHWCSFGALLVQKRQKCTSAKCTFGALLVKKNQKCTGFDALLMHFGHMVHFRCSLTKGGAFLVHFWCKSAKSAPVPCALLVHFWCKSAESAPAVWCTFGAKAPKEHQKCTSPKDPSENFLKWFQKVLKNF